MNHIIKLLTIGVLIFSMPFCVSANTIQYEWSKQPTNVQYSLAKNGVTINVVDKLNYNGYLSETWGITQTSISNGRVVACNIFIEKGHEDCLTHEVGHAIDNYNRFPFFWSNNAYWHNIYIQESRKQLLYPQGWDNPQEYFACCYFEYLNNPDFMRVIQPSSFNYLTVVFNYLD